jgi:hypothetical protein
VEFDRGSSATDVEQCRLLLPEHFLTALSPNLGHDFIAEQWENKSLGVTFRGALDICQQYNRWLGRLSPKMVCGTIEPHIWEDPN